MSILKPPCEERRRPLGTLGELYMGKKEDGATHLRGSHDLGNQSEIEQQ